MVYILVYRYRCICVYMQVTKTKNPIHACGGLVIRSINFNIALHIRVEYSIFTSARFQRTLKSLLYLLTVTSILCII